MTAVISIRKLKTKIHRCLNNVLGILLQRSVCSQITRLAIRPNRPEEPKGHTHTILYIHSMYTVRIINCIPAAIFRIRVYYEHFPTETTAPI